MDDTKTVKNSPSDDAKVVAAQDLEELTKEPTESFEKIAEDFEAGQADYQAMYNAGGDFKKGLDEIAEALEGLAPQDSTVRGKGGVEMEPHSAEASRGKLVEEVTEIPTEPEIEKKVEGYIEKVEKAGERQQVIVDDYTQAILLKPTDDKKVKVTLPLTEDQIQKGLHQQVWDSIRWLAVWCIRQIKMLKDRVVYKSKLSD